MSRSICGLFFVAALVAFASADEPKPGSALSSNIRVPANIGFATNVSQDKQVATLIFDNLFTEVNPVVQGAQGAFNQTSNQSKVFTVNVPYTTDQRSVKMTMDLRGYVSVDPGATVRLIACAGDTTQIVNLTCEDKKIDLKGQSKAALAPQSEHQQSNDYQSRMEFTLPTHSAKPVCQITLFLLAEHETDKADTGGALLVVDSLDLSINPQSDAKIKQ